MPISIASNSSRLSSLKYWSLILCPSIPYHRLSPLQLSASILCVKYDRFMKTLRVSQQFLMRSFEQHTSDLNRHSRYRIHISEVGSRAHTITGHVPPTQSFLHQTMNQIIDKRLLCTLSRSEKSTCTYFFTVDIKNYI